MRVELTPPPGFTLPRGAKHAVCYSVRRGGSFDSVETDYGFTLRAKLPGRTKPYIVFRSIYFQHVAAVIAYIPEARRVMTALDKKKPALSEGLPTLDRTTRGVNSEAKRNE